jgi:hypothetical protein
MYTFIKGEDALDAISIAIITIISLRTPGR